MRIFSGFYFLVRILVFVIPKLLYSMLRLELWFVRGAIFLFAALLISLCRPYKRTYLNILDTLLLSHLSLLCHIASSNAKGASMQLLTQVAILTPFVIFLLSIIIRIMSPLCTARFQRFILRTYLKKSSTGTRTEQQRINPAIAIVYGTMDVRTESDGN